MLSLAPSLLAVGGARTGIAPVNLLDILDVNGNFYFWSDRPIVAPAVIPPAPSGLTPPVPIPPGQGLAWGFPKAATVTVADPFITAKTVKGPNGSYTGGSIQLTRGESGETTGGQIQFSNWQLPPLPTNAVIQSIYAVGFVTIDTVGTSADSFCSLPSVSGPEYEGQSSQLLTLGAVPTYVMEISLADSVDTGPVVLDASIFVTSLGLAVYYTIPGQPGGVFPPLAGAGYASYEPWILSVPKFTMNRSLQTDVGEFLIQNLSGDTLARDVEKILRAGTLEGAQFAWRLWQPDAQAQWLRVDGTLAVDSVENDAMRLKGMQLLNPSQDDTPLEIYCETCQIQWAGRRCGSTQTTECQYSFQTCQVPSRIMVVLNDYEKNYGETLANTAQQVTNRARKF